MYEVLQINLDECNITMKITLRSSNTIYCVCSLSIDISNDEMIKVMLHMVVELVNYGCILIFVGTFSQVSNQGPESLVEI